jgi:hypothetical protein
MRKGSTILIFHGSAHERRRNCCPIVCKLCVLIACVSAEIMLVLSAGIVTDAGGQRQARRSDGGME